MPSPHIFSISVSSHSLEVELAAVLMKAVIKMIYLCYSVRSPSGTRKQLRKTGPRAAGVVGLIKEGPEADGRA